MRRSTPIILVTAGLLCLLATAAPAQVLKRHVAEFRFGAEQVSTTTAVAFPGTPDGTLIYSKTFFLPATEATLFVTLSTTGDSHEGVAHWFSARVNGRPCNLGDNGAGIAPSGWIPLLKQFDYDPPVTYTSDGVSGQTAGDGGGGTGDMHDNGIYYTWCCVDNIQPGANNTVTIRMATSFAGQPVFIERSHFYIDSVDKKLCNQAGPVPVEPGSATTELTKNKG